MFFEKKEGNVRGEKKGFFMGKKKGIFEGTDGMFMHRNEYLCKTEEGNG